MFRERTGICVVKILAFQLEFSIYLKKIKQTNNVFIKQTNNVTVQFESNKILWILMGFNPRQILICIVLQP